MLNKVHRPAISVRPAVIIGMWAIMALAIAYWRSMWCEEWNHVQHLKNGIVWAANELLNKPSPFHPGEAIFNGVAKAVFSLWNGPMELWARVQGVFWGAATVGLALTYPRAGERQRYLPWLIAFSVALISLSTQMRPYASLYFSGALAATILHEGGIKRRSVNFLSWALILFGHLYGICFLAFSLVLSGQGLKEWKKIILGGVAVAGTLLRVKVVVSQGGESILPAMEYVRQTLGTLSNPHKAILILGPMFGLGLIRLWKTERLLTLKLLALLFVTIVGPIYATVSAKYFFVPRQIVAGCFPFMVFAGEGFEWLNEILSKFRMKWLSLVVPATLLVLASVVPWTLSTLLKIPPFSDQPFNRFRELTREIANHQEWKKVLFLDTCNNEVMRDYLDTALGQSAKRMPNAEYAGFPMGTYCWGGRLCMSWINDFTACNSSVEDYMPGGRRAALMNDTSYDVIVYSTMKPLPAPRPNVAVRRDW